MLIEAMLLAAATPCSPAVTPRSYTYTFDKSVMKDPPATYCDNMLYP